MASNEELCSDYRIALHTDDGLAVLSINMGNEGKACDSTSWHAAPRHPENESIVDRRLSDLLTSQYAKVVHCSIA